MPPLEALQVESEAFQPKGDPSIRSTRPFPLPRALQAALRNLSTFGMAPSTILVIGATGNTGQSAVRTLSTLLLDAKKDTRILGLTRSLDNEVSKQLALLPNVQMMEKNWSSIDGAWLQAEGVARAFVAPHNNPDQFTDESRLYVAMLHAGVKYLVRVSTTPKYVTPTNSFDFGRSHWAAENLLSQPEFADLKWTSLQPNIFASMFLGFATEWMKEYRATGVAPVLEMTPVADQSVALIDPRDVGDVGAHLLALADPSPHSGAKYVLSGPEDFSGQEIVALFEEVAGIKVDKVNYQSTKNIDDLVAMGVLTKESRSWFVGGLAPLWTGECSLAKLPTSQAVLKLAPPMRTVKDALKAVFNQ